MKGLRVYYHCAKAEFLTLFCPRALGSKATGPFFCFELFGEFKTENWTGEEIEKYERICLLVKRFRNMNFMIEINLINKNIRFSLLLHSERFCLAQEPCI